MPRLKKQVFGKLISCVSLRTGEQREGRRSHFIDKPGLIKVYVSENQFPGKVFVSYFPYEDTDQQPYINTSCGEMEWLEDGCILTTAHTRYTFIYGVFDLTEEQRDHLFNISSRHH